MVLDILLCLKIVTNLDVSCINMSVVVFYNCKLIYICNKIYFTD